MRKGFTLVEVLMTVLILGFGMTVLLTGAARGLASLRLSKIHQDVLWTFGHAEVLFPPIATDDPQELEQPPHQFDNGHVFERTIEETDDKHLYLARSSVTWSFRARKNREEIVRYILIREP